MKHIACSRSGNDAAGIGRTAAGQRQGFSAASRGIGQSGVQAARTGLGTRPSRVSFGPVFSYRRETSLS